MKKTISVSIGGMNFVIEEDGYEKLQDYLKRLDLALEGQEGSKEIVEDIELRIAELCNECLTESKTVVELNNVLNILDTLGNPEEFVEMDEDLGTQNEDAYENQGTAERRLFRDIDNATIGGVCSGISKFFNIDVVIIRAIFVILFLFGGFGFPLYLILWVIIPKAETTIDKLRMKGRPINVETVREEVEGAADRIRKGSSKLAQKIRQEEAHYKERVWKGLHIIGALFGIALIGIGLIFLVSFLTFIVGGTQFIPVQSDHGFLSITEFGSYVLSSETDVSWAWTGGLLISICTILFLLLAGTMLIFRISNKWSKISLLLLFIGGISGGIITASVGMRTARDFVIEGEIEREIGSVVGKELVVQTQLERVESSENFNIKSNGNLGLIKVDEKNITLHGVRFVYKRSKDSSFHILQNLSCQSHSHKTAIEKSKNIHHSVGLSSDTLFVAADYSFPKNDKIRAQRSVIIIEVPVDGQVKIADRVVRLGSEEFEEEIVDENYEESGYLKGSGKYKHWD